MADLDVEAVCERFALGEPLGRARRAAVGAGGHNTLWQLRTAAGVWAVKQIGRSLPEHAEAAFEIELAAVAGGIPAPRPVRCLAGAGYAAIAGAPVRCHEWAPGEAKTNETVGANDAYNMGGIVAALHRLCIPVPPVARKKGSTCFGEQHWLQLAERGSGRPWARTIREQLPRLLAVERSLQALPVEQHAAVGSHRDLNAHNVMFSEGSMMLVDWDAAGPASPGFERASYAVLWGSQLDGGYDQDRTRAFLRGYRDAGGELDLDDPTYLAESTDGLLWWAEQNIQYALAGIGTHQDQAADVLLQATMNAPDTIAHQQAYLAECLRSFGPRGQMPLP